MAWWRRADAARESSPGEGAERDEPGGAQQTKVEEPQFRSTRRAQAVQQVEDALDHPPVAVESAEVTSGQSDPEPTVSSQGEQFMATHNEALAEAMQIDGALGAALVDSGSGMALATAGNPAGMDLNVAAAGNSNVVQAKLRTMQDLGLSENIEDILITLDSQFHIIRTFRAEQGIFLYLVLDKSRSNLAMARFKLAKIEGELQL